MSVTPFTGTGRPASFGWPAFLASLTRVPTTVGRWIERSRQRRALGELTDQDHLLADIGISRAQARRETEKPFWLG